ncbi:MULTISPECIES: N-acetylglucosamine-6-phosphate deacetylase [unclassified Thermoactinomyces]|jgi:N-acetylglucosamine-6-phosphate deacetylase|uniref:N-acetylglucosamine-6-phosphate deacetylase n=1 Tax=unclassified Thermoactinomyces TaxID=2634588 RepID=UPI0018DEC073|nr:MULTISPECIES: N-acetylglucosamine-6-phosphate deacetylase [unclassified Thermoactinomyces]MBH8596553.1 N-acetylglucosamine-6-phosphate deacetylase [Thermoactinomyces sp. CICC 10523]MBH8603314.1 N-acetylglucosamine-6-phosphate deacetylase [Thermoactinomyces sp. CICC 10522]MBH8607918.1 N-acetylglucosamine-6-phosphate deacetylase [Thermoactinomyces sp. CICC 10521]
MNKPSVLLTNAQICTANGTVDPGYVFIENGKIAALGSMEQLSGIEAGEVIDLSGKKVIPGMVDVHIHGVAGADTMDATPEALKTMAENLPKEGTTSFLATTITQSHEKIEKALVNAADFIENHQVAGQAECIGIHLEGPFINVKRAGAQPPEYIVPPDVDLFRRWQELARGHIKLVTLAPEQPGGPELVRYLKETGVIASIGHSDATYDEVVEAIGNGASHVTHLFNGMRGFHHREPGVAGAAFLRDELNVEIIADGIHINPHSVRVAYNQIGSGRIILITDAMRAKCLKRGVYDLGGQEVIVSERDARLVDGTLAGSILKMKDALANMERFAGCSMEQLVEMTSLNAVQELGFANRKGALAPGKDADIVVLDDQLEIFMTFCRGVLAYQR